ncbi:lytic transglycosylase domain-containing protein [Parvularcula sp. IMCC14364]|uniref:lytic murein transglycosylase n=1 Tax=Parvularcula sp. IMCC14364 TaxID=3067902 RepID=UPI002740BB46|nr:lytic murein transglycosylase [Parvularcula sp. IMCC14364]
MTVFMKRRSFLFGSASLLSQVVPSAWANDISSSFDQWRDNFLGDTLGAGVSESAAKHVLKGVSFKPEVLQKDRSQPEFNLSLNEYLADLRLGPYMEYAYERFRALQPFLSKLRSFYGVPSSVLFGIWAQESRFGKLVRPYNVASALATLAFDHRRSDYFAYELRCLIQMYERGVLDIEKMTGSWAGAMGQPQFMPSAYLDYAVDSDDDGMSDIWDSEKDTLASIANYLQRHGWRAGIPWGVEVPSDLAVLRNQFEFKQSKGCKPITYLTTTKQAQEWQSLGVPDVLEVFTDNTPLSVLRYRLGSDRTFLVSKNFETILRYNCSAHYAVTAGIIGDRITSR